MNQEVFEVKDVGEFLTVWPLFNEGFNEIAKQGCIKPMSESKQMSYMLNTINRPPEQRYVAVMETDKRQTACGVAVVFDGEPWVFMAYARPGTPNGVCPLLESAKTWAKMNNHTRLVARSEQLSASSGRLFQSWGFKPAAIEYRMEF